MNIETHLLGRSVSLKGQDALKWPKEVTSQMLCWTCMPDNDTVQQISNLSDTQFTHKASDGMMEATVNSMWTFDLTRRNEAVL